VAIVNVNKMIVYMIGRRMNYNMNLLHLIQQYGEGRDSSVGITTRYGLDGPGIESRWGARFSAPVQTGHVNHPASYTMGTRSFPWIERSGHGVDQPPPVSAEVKERAQLYFYSPLWAFLVCSGVNFTTVRIPVHQEIVIIYIWC